MVHEGSTAAGVPLDLDRISAVAVSHLHADHSCGLEDLGFYSKIVLGRPARLLLHPDVSARVWTSLLAGGMEYSQPDSGAPAARYQLADFFDLVDLDDRAPVVLGLFSIECRRTIHGVPTTAFRITAVGRIFGFSADTAYDPTLIDWLAPSNLIIHEATSAGHSGVHTPYEKLAELPAELRARMRLTHLPDDFDADSSAIEVLRQGRCYVV
jgi:ribonuclease BN (tRNA processing enzyme)